MIHVVCAVNQIYIQHLCAMISSLSKHTSNRIQIHVIHNDFAIHDEKFIADLFRKREHVKFSFYLISDHKLKDINIITEHLTIQTLYRLLIAEVLPSDIDKVIYLDSDLIVEQDITSLYNHELDDYVIGAVNELFEPILPIIKFNKITDYFNAGVLLINLKKWREEDFFTTCLSYAHSYPERLLFGDQDILNGVLKGEWRRIPFKWNVTRELVENKQKYYEYYPEEDFDAILAEPSIIHFTTALKPWHYLDNHPYKDRYFYYLDEIHYNYKKYEEYMVLSQKKVVVFGAGTLGKKSVMLLKQKEINVQYFCDNDSNKWGTTIDNIEVISPSELANIKDVLVMIASMYANDIAIQLSTMGFIENKEYCKIDCTHKLC